MLTTNYDLQTTIATIIDALYQQGYCVLENALPPELANALAQEVMSLEKNTFSKAGIGRNNEHQNNETIRSDKIHWLSSEQSQIQADYLAWADELKQAVNRRLFLGLFSYESHYAHYQVGDFYKRHLDAFKGQTNRVLSVVTYLNPDWKAHQGGELVLYLNEEDQQGIKVQPKLGTVVVFLSDEFPHEVLPATHERFSIAGWFRVNTSAGNRVDPPR